MTPLLSLPAPRPSLTCNAFIAPFVTSGRFQTSETLMKRLLLSTLLSISVLAPGLAQTADDDLGDSSSSSTTPADTTGSTTGGHHRLLAQLDLTEAQKAQIRQIVQSTTDKAQRRQQIRAILTPEQKMKLRQLIRERRAARQSAAQPAATN
jgi:Spy/CpxP family protein refolding chaperone